MIQDPSMVHEALTYKLFLVCRRGRPAHGFAFVTLNGQAYGVFSEPRDARRNLAAALRFTSAPSTSTRRMPPAATSPPAAPRFEVDEGSEADRTDLEALIGRGEQQRRRLVGRCRTFANLDRDDQDVGGREVRRALGRLRRSRAERTRQAPRQLLPAQRRRGLFQMMPWGTDQTWEREDLRIRRGTSGVVFNKSPSPKRELQADVPGEPHRIPPLSGPRQGRACGPARRRCWRPVRPKKTKQEGNQPCRSRRRVETSSLRPCAPRAADRLSRRGRRPWVRSQPLGEPPAPRNKPPAQKQDGPPPTTARRGHPHAKGRFIATALDVTGALRRTSTSSARIGGRRRQLCARPSTRRSAGRLVVRCRLPEPALNRLAEGSMKLKVQIGFNPVLGESRVVREKPDPGAALAGPPPS